MGVPEQLGNYRIFELIAEGGMASVYRARHPDSHDKDLALKVVHAEVAADPRLQAMFLTEARVALVLSHAHVVQTFDVSRHEDGVLLAMEHVDGLDLARLVHTYAGRYGDALPLRHVLLIVADALSGLDYAHRCRGADGAPLGLVHRDVSPSNLLISTAGEVKVADFGVAASSLRQHPSLDGALKGKIAYMAPEQLRAQPTDARTDVYAMGVVLYELLTGRRPYAGTGVAIIPDVMAGQFPRPRELNPDVPEAFESVALCAMATAADVRYVSAAAMGRALHDAAASVRLVPSQLELGGIVETLRSDARASIPPAGPGPGPTLAGPAAKRRRGE
ncbi:MAG: serine/threonine-protein kinase [Sandaracinaceae bacterium]